ncbi:hypothetical protein CDCA_CDCA12G3504 [Cyanidium caldarium]|uniref:E2F/DP family winged-helix DNA-binding domain-containing protein n=1 Tax=Cyanidium caldarium TaxID=2771 RepID=A0AAV9IYZ7_CYACA|nr:hypothetical protein CDCA_CDCA12G3504 [Cyanidium caldarium]
MSGSESQPGSVGAAAVGASPSNVRIAEADLAAPLLPIEPAVDDASFLYRRRAPLYQASRSLPVARYYAPSPGGALPPPYGSPLALSAEALDDGVQGSPLETAYLSPSAFRYVALPEHLSWSEAEERHPSEGDAVSEAQWMEGWRNTSARKPSPIRREAVAPASPSLPNTPALRAVRSHRVKAPRPTRTVPPPQPTTERASASNPYVQQASVDIADLMTDAEFLLKHFHPSRAGTVAGACRDRIRKRRTRAAPLAASAMEGAGRYHRSIGYLTARFLARLATAEACSSSCTPPGDAPPDSCAAIAAELRVPPRRIYDVIGVLEAIGVVERGHAAHGSKTSTMRVRLRSLTPTQLLSAESGARAERAALESALQEVRRAHRRLDAEIDAASDTLRELLQQAMVRPGCTEAATPPVAQHLVKRLRRTDSPSTPPQRRRWLALRLQLPPSTSRETASPLLVAQWVRSRHLLPTSTRENEWQLQVSCPAQLLEVPLTSAYRALAPLRGAVANTPAVER